MRLSVPALALLGALVSSGTHGCGSSVATVGAVDAGNPFVSTNDSDGGSAPALRVAAVADSPQICAGQCVELSAVASGGVAPYSYAWTGVVVDGGMAKVCPTTTTTYSVTATDSSASTGEFNSTGAHGTADLTVTVSSSCGADAAAPPGDGACPSAGEAPPQPGLYAGSVSCGPGSQWNNYSGTGDGGPTIVQDGGGGMLGTISVDLSVDATTGEPTGTWYFQWNLFVIAGGGSLQAAYVCGGSEVSATFVDSTWGVPTGNMMVIPTGGLAGSLTAARVPGMPGTIGGFFTYTSSVANSMGDVCIGSYTATLSPADAGAD